MYEISLTPYAVRAAVVSWAFATNHLDSLKYQVVLRCQKEMIISLLFRIAFDFDILKPILVTVIK